MGNAAVSEIGKDVDRPSEKFDSLLSALQAIADSGTKIDDKAIACVSEMLMSNCLNWTASKLRRRGSSKGEMEVRRKLCGGIIHHQQVEELQVSNPFHNTHKTAPRWTEWEMSYV